MLTAFNIRKLQYDFHAPKTLEKQGNHIANHGECGMAEHYPCPDFLTLTRARKRASYVMTHFGLMLRVSLCA